MRYIKVFVAILLVLPLSALFAAGSKEVDASSQASKHEQKDASVEEKLTASELNEGLEFKEYSRIVSVSAGAVETIYMIGGEDALVGLGESRQGIWPQEKTSLLPSVGNLARPSIEAIIALEPDLVILNSMVSSLGANLKRRGIDVYMHEVDSIKGIINTTKILGIFTQQEAAAEQLIQEKTLEFEALQNAASERSRLKGAFLYSASPIMAFTDQSLPGEILEILGVNNLATGLDMARPMLSPEYVIQENPDFLFCAMAISKPEDVLEPNAFIRKTRAGQEGNIQIIPSSLFLRPSPRIFEELPKLASMLDELR